MLMEIPYLGFLFRCYSGPKSTMSGCGSLKSGIGIGLPGLTLYRPLFCALNSSVS
jgi:hypothetical protein